MICPSHTNARVSSLSLGMVVKYVSSRSGVGQQLDTRVSLRLHMSDQLLAGAKLLLRCQAGRMSSHARHEAACGLAGHHPNAPPNGSSFQPSAPQQLASICLTLSALQLFGLVSMLLPCVS